MKTDFHDPVHQTIADHMNTSHEHEHSYQTRITPTVGIEHHTTSQDDTTQPTQSALGKA